jgi:hypothetical protein
MDDWRRASGAETQAVQSAVTGKASRQTPLKTMGALKLWFVHPCEVRFEGTLASPATQAELKRYLAEVHDRIVKDACRSMTVDVRGLQFVDSSAIRLFVDWSSRATEAGYKILFLVDAAMTWQRISFGVLKSMAPATIEIRETDSDVTNS